MDEMASPLTSSTPSRDAVRIKVIQEDCMLRFKFLAEKIRKKKEEEAEKQEREEQQQEELEDNQKEAENNPGPDVSEGCDTREDCETLSKKIIDEDRRKEECHFASD